MEFLARICPRTADPDESAGIYPDASHGFLDQYPNESADHVNAFLNGA
jgi:hypothetical protein